MSQKIKSKEEFLKVFNEFTNNIFEPDSSEIIKKIKSFSLTPNTAKETILKNIIDPINRQNRLKLGYFPISHIIPKRDRKGKKLAITSNHENIYLTDLFSANVTKKLLIASKISEQFKENYSDINEVLNVIDKIDLDKGKDNTLQIINEIDTKYKIILIDITKKENKKIKYDWNDSVMSTKESGELIIFLKINIYKGSKETHTTTTLPVYLLDDKDPTKSKLVLNNDDFQLILTGRNKDIDLTQQESKAPDLTLKESTVQESKPESKSPKQSTESKEEETASKMPQVPSRPLVEDLTQADQKVDESKEEVKTESEEETASKMPQVPSRPLVEDLTQGDHEGDESKVDLTVDKSKEEVKTDLEESKSDTILKDNPYDKNQFLRPIYFKELPGKKFLQGRANPYIKKTCYNIYEDKSDNKLVGLLEYTSIGDNIKVNVNWCSNYSPN
jgi:hypothetical protein